MPSIAWHTCLPSHMMLAKEGQHNIQLRFIYVRNQTEKPHIQHRPETLLHKECNKLMLLRRNEAVDGLVSLRMTVNAMQRMGTKEGARGNKKKLN